MDAKRASQALCTDHGASFQPTQGTFWAAHFEGIPTNFHTSGVRSRHLVLNTTAGTGREKERVATVPDILITAVAGQFASHLRYRANCVLQPKKYYQFGLLYDVVHVSREGIRNFACACW
jgi:hypothetical protein